MEIPVRVAFCPLLWTSNGGHMRKDGKPDLKSYEMETAPDGGEATWVQARRGYCDRVYDCDQCFLMQKFLKEERGRGARDSWECSKCAFTSSPGELRATPCYYTSRMSDGDQYPLCDRCGEDYPILQLVLRINDV